jgi:hypothetical protein
MRTLATRATACVVALMAWWSVAAAQTIPDFSGTWTADPDRAVLLRRVDITSNGWGNVLDGLRRYRPYTLKISQSSGALDIDFPQGANTFLKADPYALNGAKTTHVRDMGEYWRKLVTEATWDGSALTLKATRQVDWWTKARPEDVVRQDTQLGTVYVLKLEQGGAQLVVETTLSDEKGQAQYRMVFTKAS